MSMLTRRSTHILQSLICRPIERIPAGAPWQLLVIGTLFATLAVSTSLGTAVVAYAQALSPALAQGAPSAGQIPSSQSGASFLGAPTGQASPATPYQAFLNPPSVYRIPPEVGVPIGPSGRELPSAPAATPVGGAELPSAGARPLFLSEVSWTYRPPSPPRVLRLHDIVVVLVDEKTQVISEGELDRRKTANAAWTLKDWILLKGLSLIPDPQSRGDPKISGEVEQRFRAEGDFQSRGAMKFRIACEIVDIRPNGTLVIEGRRWLRNNDEVWEIFLLGTIRPEDVLPNNTVLSENVANLRVYKREIGQVRDGYRRGWFTRLLDDYQPF
ncbi:MAG: flagellar basal body L-ring protein FlgH [Thermoguttaceae bacterium]|nr:flagellar basal body L-ring protein FlgH [Thermoguttaceae bacterium]MDW8079448.1 flagellar basal body L-ring protein FlgH [Thermoguttaceae bacterium]